MFLNTDSKGQCAFEGDVVIADQSTTSIPIFICGAVNNDLSTNNGLCAVTVHFKHEFIGDIIMELVSPSGQKVTLVGPSETISASTSLVTCWNVQFFADSLEAVPDSGYDPIWNSLQTWLGFTTYVGKYYPFMDMLEDFDTGPVDGTWTLNIIDNVQFGEGHIYCLDLVFCNPDGITGKTCELVNHTFEEDIIEACQGDIALDLDIAPEFDIAYDTSLYGYSYLLFKEDKFQSVIPDQNLMSFDAGEYTLCGILYALEDLTGLNNIPVDETNEGVETFILENNLCASISDVCIDVIILLSPEIVTEVTTICQGDTIIVNGVSYTETGLYDINTIQEPCDSMSILDLTVHNLEVFIEAESGLLSCDEPTTMLNGSLTSIPLDATVSWRSADGNIISNMDSVIIEIDRPGTYTFEVNIQGCIFSEDILIGETDDYVYVDLSTNILTCILDSTFIDLTVSDAIDTIFWTGSAIFSELNEDIRVGSGGIYTVTFITTLGCEITRDIEVIEDRDYPDLTISGDTLTCTQGEVILSTFPMDTLGSTFRWFDANGDLSSDTFLIVNEPGLYSLELITELNCVATFSYEVISEIEIIEVELISDTIDCNDAFVTVAYVSETSGLDVLWENPNGDPLIDSTFSTSISGEYNLSLNDSKGCTLDTFLVVGIDSLLPEVSIFDASFLCGDDSIQLNAQTNFEDLSYVWTRPDNTTDVNMSPFIFSPGIYILEVCRPNGCCARDTVEVGVDNTVPLLSFESENLNCTHDTVFIIPSDTSSYLMEWSLNDVDLVVDSNIIEVTVPGFYEVLVTDELNGCKSKYSFDIVSDFFDEIDSLFAEPLNCVNLEVQIITTALRSFDTYTWSGSGLVDNNLDPFVNMPGEYVIEYTFTNGCSGTDTIEVLQEGEFPNLQGDNQTITCNDDEVTLSVEYSSSSISVVWIDPNENEILGTSIQASEPGTYTVIGVALGSCTDTIEVELFADTIPPMLTIIDDGEITCVDSVVMITATIDSNTDLYKITGPEVVDSSDLIFEVETPGIYTITAIGENGCLSTASVEITQSTDFPSYEINLDSLTCDESNVTVGFESPDPNLSVIWDGPINILDDNYAFSTTQAGNYIFTITNSFGCTLEDSFFVVMDTFPPNSAIDLSSQINCLTDEVLLSITNYSEDLVVNWTGPGVVDPTASEFVTSDIGIYTLTLQSINGCITEDEITVVYDTLSPEVMILGDPINCSAGKTFLRVESDLTISTYTWDGPVGFESTEAEPLIFAEGVYHVTVVAENGCISSDSILVEDERVFPEIEVEDFYLPCDGSAVQVFTSFISEGSFVRWFGPNNYFSDSTIASIFEAGEYIGIAFNEDGCTTQDTFQVIDEPIFPEFSGFSELLLCLGPIPLTAVDIEDDISLHWNGPNGFFSEDNPALTEEPGIYQLVVTGINGCIDSVDVEVIDGRIYPIAMASINDPFQCNNLEVNLSGEGSSVGNIYTTQWSTVDGNILQGSNTLNPKINHEGTYILEIMDTNIGCSSYDTLIVVIEEQGLKGAEIEIVEPTCLNFGNAELNFTEFLGGFPPYTIFVDDFDYGIRTNIPYLTSGEHLISIIDSLGCQHDTLIVILDEGVLTVELPSDTTLCFGDSLLIQPIINLSSDSISSIVWSSNIECDSCRDVQIFLNNDINISIQVTDINGCMVEENFSINVERPNNLPFPQIFSPNGDNINDVFYMPMTKGLVSINYMKIYDNWGGLLYNEVDLEPGDASRGWRGTINGQNAEIAVYVVEAQVTLVDGSQVVYVGDVTLVR